MLAVMLFASLAPGVSHALAAWTGNASFVQKICTSDGRKVVIQVKTTMGQQLSTELAVKPAVNADNDDRHLAHCAFCSSAHHADAMPAASPFIIGLLEAQAWQVAVAPAVPAYSRFVLSPPSHAPPNS